MIEYEKRLVEVDEILNYLSKEDYNKIPKDYIEAIKQNKDNNYIWKYDKKKKLKDQDVSDDTIAILSYLNTKFLLNNEQKNYIYKLHEVNNVNSSFNSEIYIKDIFSNNKNEIRQNTDMVLEHNKSLFKKIIKKILNLFNNKK